MPLQTLRTSLAQLLSLIVLLICVGCAPAMNENWVQVETQHIRLRSNEGESAARKMAERLQRMHDVVHASVLSCGFKSQEDRIEVTSLSPHHFTKVAGRDVAGFFRPAPQGAMGRRADQIVLPNELGVAVRQVFQHELAHQLVANCFPAAPMWLNEGMAGFLETLQVSGKTMSIGFPRYVVSEYSTSSSAVLFRGQIIEQVYVGSLPTTLDLLKISGQEFYTPAHSDERELVSKRQGNYTAAWGLVHFLQLGAEDLHDPFQRYLQALIDGTDPQAAWQAELGGIPLDERLREYLLHSANGYLVRDYEPPAPSQPPSLRALTPTESELHLAWLWGFDDPARRTQAKQHAQRTLEYDAANSEAALILTLTFLHEKKPEQALKQLESALAPSPDDPALLALWLSLASRDGNTSAAAKNAARLRRGATAPMHFAVLARYDVLLGDSEQALKDSKRSIESGPSCSECWEARAVALASSHKWPGALAAARRAGHLVPHAASATLARLKALQTQLEKLQAEHRASLLSQTTNSEVLDLTAEPITAPTE